jgi:hypothetical protein
MQVQTLKRTSRWYASRVRTAWKQVTSRTIPVDRILCGGEHGMTALQFSRHTDVLKRASAPIAQSPQCQLLADYNREGNALFEPQRFERTAYFKNAEACIQSFGKYFSAIHTEEVVTIARTLVGRLNGHDGGARLPASNAFSNPREPIVVRPIRFSDCYQLVDGNHRVALAIAHGQTHMHATIVDPPQLTCLQQLLLDVSWNVNRRDLYQPVSSPELSPKYWRLVRQCTDRLALMLNFVRQKQPDAFKRNASYLDLACNFGWFVKAFADEGFDAYGLEIDRPSRTIGQVFLGLDKRQLIAGDVYAYLERRDKVYDYTSCLSLAHNVLLRAGEAAFDTLLQGVAGITSKVLFLEMGDGDEEWFKQSLKGWNQASIRTRLRNSGYFSDVVLLGTDSDRREPFATNYHRSLFACIK